MSSVPATEPEPTQLRFSLRSILIFTLFVAVLLGWGIDHWRAEQRLAIVERHLAIVAQERMDAQSQLFIEISKRASTASGYRPALVESRPVRLESRPDRDTLERELTRVLGELQSANARIEEFEIRQQFLSTARAEAAELFQDLPGLQKYLEWSLAQEEQFLRLPSSDQQKVVERARVLESDAPLDDEAARTWRKDPLLARGVEKRIARQSRANAKRR